MLCFKGQLCRDLMGLSKTKGDFNDILSVRIGKYHINSGD